VPDLTAPPTGGTTAPVEAVLVPLINQLASLTVPLVLVLDDYHAIVNAAIDEALVFLVDNAPPDVVCPPALHLVVATRANPSLPLPPDVAILMALCPRWRARRQLVEIRADDRT